MAPAALITGATGGIGKAIAEALAPTHRLYLVGRNRQGLDDLAARLPEATVVAADLSTAQGLAQVAEAVDEVQIVVHSAGILRMGTVEEVEDADWVDSFQVNVLAPVALTKRLLPQLRAASGHVFLINSGLGHRTIAGSGPYSASKFALKAFADALRLEEAAHGVKVTSIHPGRVGTDMQAQLHAWEGKEYDQNAWVRPEQVAQAVLAAVNLGSHANLDSININPAPAATA